MSSQKFAKYAAATAAGLLLSVTVSVAGPTYTFSTSVGSQPSDVGVITLTQVVGGCGSTGTACVDVLVDLAAPTYGFLNTGGPHTPFTFTISGTETGVTASFLQPVGGSFTTGNPPSLQLLTLDLLGGSNTSYGTFGIAIDSSAGNGSVNAYYGDLEFVLTRPGGLSTDDFIANSDNVYFAADLTDGSNTGAQAWLNRNVACTDCGSGGSSTPVPEPGSLMLLGGGLIGLGLVGALLRRRHREDECHAPA